jgi:hypothetical protein
MAATNHPTITNAKQPVAHFKAGGNPHNETIVAQIGNIAPATSAIKSIESNVSLLRPFTTGIDNITCAKGAAKIRIRGIQIKNRSLCMSIRWYLLIQMI